MRWRVGMRRRVSRCARVAEACGRLHFRRNVPAMQHFPGPAALVLVSLAALPSFAQGGAQDAGVTDADAGIAPASSTDAAGSADADAGVADADAGPADADAGPVDSGA